MAIEIKEEWYPMPLQLGPPLPRSMQVYWPWVKRPPEEEVPAPPAPPAPPTPPGAPPAVKYRLYIYTVGSGTVTPTDGEYPSGSVVTLTAKPGYGAAFDSWSGDAAGISPMFNITMDSNKTATAYFKAITPPPYDEVPPPGEIPPVPPPPPTPPPEEPPPEVPPPPSPPPPAPSALFTFSNLAVSRTRCQSATAWNTLDFRCTITNPTDRSITHTLTPMYRTETKSGYSDPYPSSIYAREITILPGGSYEYYLAGSQPDRCTMLIGFSAGVPYGGCAFLRDENGNDSPQACV